MVSRLLHNLNSDDVTYSFMSIRVDDAAGALSNFSHERVIDGELLWCDAVGYVLLIFFDWYIIYGVYLIGESKLSLWLKVLDVLHSDKLK